LKQCHCAQNCESNKKCRKCNRRHHQSLCDKPSNDSENAEATTSAEISYNNTTNSVKDSKAILLQTAKAVACDLSEANKARGILFDNGSQRSYITESLKQRLRLTVSKRHLNTFGDDRFKS